MPILAYFFLHFAIYFSFRLLFLVWNWPSLRFLSKSQLLTAFTQGARFDLAALSVTAGLFVFGLIWLQKNRYLRQIWVALFWFLNVIFALVNCVDTELVNFTGRRFTKSALFLVGEGGLSNLILPYLPLAFATAVIVAGTSYIAFITTKKLFLPSRPLARIGFSFAVVFLVVIGFRGGLQSKPISFVEGRIFSETIANQLVLNSTFTFLKSLGKPHIERLNFFSDSEMLGYLKNDFKTVSVPTELANKNVVLIILESFSDEYIKLSDPQFTPFLNSLSGQGVSINKAYANGLRSIEGVGAILAGVPALMEEPFINSEFASNQFIGLGTVLKAKGYHTSFFHGARNGSMHFDSFTKSAGIENYFGKNEYPNAADDDGVWGIFDKPFLSWACQQMTAFPQPFMSTVFTLSSHQPYTIPAAEKSQHPEGVIPVLKAIHYTDQALQNFMKCAEQKSWYQNTLFIFTADHAGPPLNASAPFENRFRIPLLFFTADRNLLAGLSSDQEAQQIDILPTLLDSLGIEQKSKNLLARSLWQQGPKQIALYADGVYELVGETKNKEKQLQAIRQYFSQGLFDNKLYYPVSDK